MNTDVPEGWHLVPSSPSMAMLSAAQAAWIKDPQKRTTTLYAAMLDAAPAPPNADHPADLAYACRAALRFVQEERENRESAGGDMTDYVGEAREIEDLLAAALGIAVEELDDEPANG